MNCTLSQALYMCFFSFFIHHSLRRTRYYYYLDFIDVKTGAFWSHIAKGEPEFRHTFFFGLRSQLFTIKHYCFQVNKIYRDLNYRAKAIASFKTSHLGTMFSQNLRPGKEKVSVAFKWAAAIYGLLIEQAS